MDEKEPGALPAFEDRCWTLDGVVYGDKNIQGREHKGLLLTPPGSNEGIAFLWVPKDALVDPKALEFKKGARVSDVRVREGTRIWQEAVRPIHLGDLPGGAALPARLSADDLPCLEVLALPA